MSSLLWSLRTVVAALLLALSGCGTAAVAAPVAHPPTRAELVASFCRLADERAALRGEPLDPGCVSRLSLSRAPVDIEQDELGAMRCGGVVEGEFTVVR